MLSQSYQRTPVYGTAVPAISPHLCMVLRYRLSVNTCVRYYGTVCIGEILSECLLFLLSLDSILTPVHPKRTRVRGASPYNVISWVPYGTVVMYGLYRSHIYGLYRSHMYGLYRSHAHGLYRSHMHGLYRSHMYGLYRSHPVFSGLRSKEGSNFFPEHR